MESAPLGLWAALSAPACAVYAVAAANRARIEAPALALPRPIMIAFAASAALVVASAPTSFSALEALVLASVLAYLAAFDLRAMAVPVWPILIAIALGLAAALVESAAIERALAALAGWGALSGLDLVYRRLRGISGLGAGDALVAALIGSWLSFAGLVWSVALGAILGVVWALADGRAAREPMPLVPALAAGAALAMVFQGWLG